MNKSISRRGFVDPDGSRWISVTEAVVRYRCDPDKLRLLVLEGEVEHRCISIDGRAVHFVEDTKILLRLSNDDGASWFRDFFNIGVGAVSGAVANQFVDDWFDEEGLPPDQVASVLARVATKEFLPGCKPWPAFGRFFDPGLQKVAEIHSVGADLEYFFSFRRADHFSKADFLAYSRFKKSFHVFSETVSRMGLQRWAQPCRNPACSGSHYLLSIDYFTHDLPGYFDERGAPVPDQVFVVDFMRFVGVAPSTSLEHHV